MGENLKEKIEKEFKKALLERNTIEISTLRLLKARIFDEEIKKGSPLSEAELKKVIASEIKKRREAIEQYKKGKREDLWQKEEKELEILMSFLGKEISNKELENLIKKAIKKVNATSLKDMGKVMKELMPEIQGRVDGNLVAQLVRKILSES
ncbi:GatB/YqeY domain-containing protein [Candidatus Parcubacteria bacterium]|nr:GatB/YqeY domain-containing protein [Candidatus Parcubacteria bacterium]